MQIDLTRREGLVAPDGEQPAEAPPAELVWTHRRVLVAVNGELVWADRRELVSSRRASPVTAEVDAAPPAARVPRQSGTHVALD